MGAGKNGSPNPKKKCGRADAMLGSIPSNPVAAKAAKRFMTRLLSKF
jgi:hypothetical protein